MLFNVTLVASGIQVTASNKDDARRFAKKDGIEFFGDWNYTLSAVTQSDATEVVDKPAGFDKVCCIKKHGKGEGALWTFDGYVDIIVDVADVDDAFDAALEFIRIKAIENLAISAG